MKLSAAYRFTFRLIATVCYVGFALCLYIPLGFLVIIERTIVSHLLFWIVMISVLAFGAWWLGNDEPKPSSGSGDDDA